MGVHFGAPVRYTSVYRGRHRAPVCFRWEVLLLLGHIDGVSAEKIGGWIFDTEHPDCRVEVSIYVDGEKIAQIACDRERPDLKQSGRHGDGKHGFLYRFDPPLSTDIERTVVARRSPDGIQVANGRCVLTSSGPRYVPAPFAARPEQSMRIPGLRNPRQLLDILTLYDNEHELYDLLTAVDFNLSSARDAHFCVFGCYPKDGDQTLPIDTNMRDVINALMLGERFTLLSVLNSRHIYSSADISVSVITLTT